tara:strand:- start:7476 stop:7661 length:186 start_codon:yes stop_codon:yes gene_type:complete
MSISSSVFVHDTKKIKIVKCIEGVDGSTHNSWDIAITDKDGNQVKVFCFGDEVSVMLTEGE